jgi:hypothetical protein
MGGVVCPEVNDQRWQLQVAAQVKTISMVGPNDEIIALMMMRA